MIAFVGVVNLMYNGGGPDTWILFQEYLRLK